MSRPLHIRLAVICDLCAACGRLVWQHATRLVLTVSGH